MIYHSHREVDHSTTKMTISGPGQTKQETQERQELEEAEGGERGGPGDRGESLDAGSGQGDVEC